MTLARTNQQLAIRNAASGSAETVPHLDRYQVESLMQKALELGRGDKGERNALLIASMFDSCLRVSEAIGIRPMDLRQTPTGWVVRVLGKGRRTAEVAISTSLVAQLHSYAYKHGIDREARFFPVTPQRVHQFMQEYFSETGIRKPDHVGAVHVLRHSGALERLKATGNPKAVQDQLRHRSAAMTLKYLKTLSAKESLEINQQVDLGW